MLDKTILHGLPTPGAYTAEPMTAAEIDACSDADRIWATIHAAVFESWLNRYDRSRLPMKDCQ